MFEVLWPVQELGLTLDQISPTGEALDLHISLTSATATCPLCRHPSAAVHSHYPRTLCDLPLANFAVRLRLRVRRFFCRVADCPRRVFAEPLGSLAQPYAHRTTRLADSLRHIGLALGGQAGSRLTADLHLPSSPDNILHLVRLTPDEPLLCSPRYLGVDDFCWRRGQTYGTILVDLESGRVIDLLPDREADTFATWLTQHPGAELISWDRASAYSEGAARGAPDARQTADRFHLLKNLADALEELLSRLRSELRQSVQRPTSTPAAAAPSDGDQQAVSATPLIADLPPTAPGNCTIETTPRPTQPISTETAAAAPLIPAPAPTRQPKRSVSQQRPMTLSQSSRSERVVRYEEVCRLHELGWSQRAIAQQVNLVPKTVRRWLQQGRFPERQEPPARSSKLDGYKAYIRTRCAQGCWNAKHIWREITEQQDYRGGHTRVRDFVAELRKDPKLGGQAEPKANRALGWQLPSARELKWLLMKAVGELDDEHYELVRELCRQSREVTVAYGLITDFQELVRHRRAGELSNWVELARASGVREIESFARGILRDFAAVYTGLELEWSNGVVEGNVNRLKLFKRQGYGRANWGLLRKRLLHAS